MSSNSQLRDIRIGLVADEPIRAAGLASIFEQTAQEGRPRLIPIPGSAEELLAGDTPAYILVDLHSSPGIEILQTIHRARPSVRLIVIGPQGDDELVIRTIEAGARAYLEPAAGPETVREAIEVVTSGSIWAPRKVLSKLIDRLLREPAAKLAAAPQQLTAREQQVMELIVMARSNKEIAEQLGIEERTVKAYVGRLMRKTGSDNRVKLSLIGLGQAVIQQEDARKNPALK